MRPISGLAPSKLKKIKKNKGRLCVYRGIVDTIFNIELKVRKKGRRKFESRNLDEISFILNTEKVDLAEEYLGYNHSFRGK